MIRAITSYKLLPVVVERFAFNAQKCLASTSTNADSQGRRVIGHQVMYPDLLRMHKDIEWEEASSPEEKLKIMRQYRQALRDLCYYKPKKYEADLKVHNDIMKSMEPLTRRYNAEYRMRVKFKKRMTPLLKKLLES